MSTLTLVVLLGCGALLVYATYRVVFWMREGQRILKQAGYVGPRPSIWSRIVRWFAGRLMVFLTVGPIKVIGEDNLNYYGRLIALGNHQTERDAVLALWMMGGRKMRYFIANNQAAGWRAPLVAYTGGIVVDSSTPYRAGLALRAAIVTVRKEAGSSFVVFPQGRLDKTNTLRRRDFKPGTAKLGQRIAETSSERVAYLPFGIYYERDPKYATTFHRLMNKWAGVENFRKFFGEITYGAVIAVGAPIPVEILPDDPYKATDILFQQVCALSARARLAAHT